MFVGQRVRVMRTIDLGEDFCVREGDIGEVISTTNGPYLHYLVRLPHTDFAATEEEIGDDDSDA